MFQNLKTLSLRSKSQHQTDSCNFVSTIGNIMGGGKERFKETERQQRQGGRKREREVSVFSFSLVMGQ